MYWLAKRYCAKYRLGQEFVIETVFSHNVSMDKRKWQAVRETVQGTFHMLLVGFVGIVIADALTYGSIRYQYMNLDYALLAVLVFGLALLILDKLVAEER